jgi:hypothetical protein
MKILTSPPYHSGLKLNWTAATWAGAPSTDGVSNQLVWASSTSPPVVGPFDWAAYGYSSCTGYERVSARAGCVCACVCGCV